MKPPKNFYNNLDRRKQGLPEVPEASAADAGKVVKVSSEGSYELAQDAGAKELIVTLSRGFTADKTYTEILTALNNGDIVKLVDWIGRNYIYSGKTSERICFAYLDGHTSNNITDVFTIAVDDTNSWEQLLDTIEHLPTVSSADAGKVLTVENNGAWGIEDIPKELPTVTSADAGKVLTVDSQGNWGAKTMASKVHTLLIYMDNVAFNATTNKYSGLLKLKVDNTDVNYNSSSGTINIDFGALFSIFIYTANVIALRGVGFNYNMQYTSRTCIERVLQNCVFFNDLDNKTYKITNITGASSSQNFEFELVELSA